MSRPIDDILTPKSAIRPPSIYAYSIADEAHQGLLKLGHTTRHVVGFSTLFATGWCGDRIRAMEEVT